MDDVLLTESKNLDRETDEILVQMDKDKVKDTFKGVGILLLFLTACICFVGGVVWTADKVGVDLKSYVNPNDK